MRKLSLVLLALTIAASAFAQPQRKVAVMNFDYATVQSNVTAIFGSNQDVGKGIADLLVDRFVTDKAFRVIERKELDKILAEQNFSNSDRADPASAAKLGRVLGVDCIIIGSITQFGRDDKSVGAGGKALGGFGSKFGLGGVGQKSSKAVVGISARMVSTSTAEILAVASGIGESERSGVNLVGDGGSGGSGGGGFFDMKSSNFGATILGEAVGKAVTNVAKQIEQNATNVPVQAVVINGLVADATGDTLILNIGTRAGIKVGDKLEVTRPVREIKDPATGKVLRKIENKLGEIVITEADEGSAVGKYTGSQPAKVGDAVKNP